LYDYFKGELASCDLSYAVVDCGGVGYKLSISLNTHKKIRGKETVKLFAYLNVKEDAMDLFGFADENERYFFTLLLSISGVGPKAAMAILSEYEPNDLALHVASGDYKALTKAAGIGAKTAQRIVLELKDKFKSVEHIPTEISYEYGRLEAADYKDEAIEALTALGYSKNDARNAVMKCPAENTSDLIKQALRLLSRI